MINSFKSNLECIKLINLILLDNQFKISQLDRAYNLIRKMSLIDVLIVLFGSVAVFALTTLLIGIFLPKLFEYLVGFLFFVTWEERGNIIKVSAVIRANFFAMNFFGNRNKLAIFAGFPLPYYYTFKANGQQKVLTVIKQIRMALQKATKKLSDAVASSSDPFYTILDELNMVEEMGPDEIYNTDIIRNTYSKEYSFSQESLFGELILNGQNPYAISKLVIEKEGSSVKYQQTLFEAFEHNDLDTNITDKIDFGFELPNLRKEVEKGREIYVLDLKYLRELYVTEPFENMVNIQILADVKGIKTILQFPYAIFVRSTNKETEQEGFICLGAVFRYTLENKYVAFSPFFKKNNNMIAWTLARCHIALIHFNDFTFRTHLGVLHLATSQYNVPLYNYKNFTLKNQPEKSARLEKFFRYAYEPFNRGLEGVNISAATTLIHPKYPVVSNSFTLSPAMALALISKEAGAINFNKFNPAGLAREAGLEELLQNEDTAIHFDDQMYNVLAKYISKVYDICNIDEFAPEIIKDINETIMPFHPTRPKITDLKALVTNLVFCWTVYHCHTFSNLSVSSNLKLRPPILCQKLPCDEAEWDQIKEQTYTPPTKILIEISKLNKAVTLRDPDNLLLDILARKCFKAKKYGDEKIAEAAQQAGEKLRIIGHKLFEVNEKRQKNRLFKMPWLEPEKMQASLNI